MSAGWHAFESLVLADRTLQARLLAEPERGRFLALVCDLAQAEGMAVTADEVEAALEGARQRHRERWV